MSDWYSGLPNSVPDPSFDSQLSNDANITVKSDGQNARAMFGSAQDAYGATGKNFGAKISKPGINVMTAANSDTVFRTDFNSFTFNDGTVDRIIIGLLPDGSYGMVVSKPGIDVYSAF